MAGVAVARAGVAHLSHMAQGLARFESAQEQARTAHEARLGRILFGALNQLKGTALKASQLLSMELGFLPGHIVTPGLSAPGGDPRVFRVDGSEVALRRETAERLHLRPRDHAEHCESEA